MTREEYEALTKRVLEVREEARVLMKEWKQATLTEEVKGEKIDKEGL